MISFATVVVLINIALLNAQREIKGLGVWQKGGAMRMPLKSHQEEKSGLSFLPFFMIKNIGYSCK